MEPCSAEEEPGGGLMRKFLETADIARREGVVTATIRADVFAGHLEVAAMTERGGRLFTESEYKRYALARGRGGKGLPPDRTRSDGGS